MPVRLMQCVVALAFLGMLGPARMVAQPPAPGIAESLSMLADQPSTHTGVVFDRSEIETAQALLEAGGLDAERAKVALKSISFDTYKYSKPAFYTPEAFTAILGAFKEAGWKHLVNKNQTPANTAQPKNIVTDLWLHFTGADIDRVTVLIRAPKDMNVIQVTGDLRPLDLVHLSGHFGIPKVDPDAVMVPDGK